MRELAHEGSRGADERWECRGEEGVVGLEEGARRGVGRCFSWEAMMASMGGVVAAVGIDCGMDGDSTRPVGRRVPHLVFVCVEYLGLPML